jgi:hypothetical protein
MARKINSLDGIHCVRDTGVAAPARRSAGPLTTPNESRLNDKFFGHQRPALLKSTDDGRSRQEARAGIE